MAAAEPSLSSSSSSVEAIASPLMSSSFGSSLMQMEVSISDLFAGQLHLFDVQNFPHCYNDNQRQGRPFTSAGVRTYHVAH